MSDSPHMPPGTTEVEALRIFVEHAPVAMAMLDRNLRYVCTSRRWRELAGGGDTPLAGKLHYDVFPNPPQIWRERHARALGGEISRGDREPIRRGGVTMHVRWEIRPWHDAAGAIGGILLLSEDLTPQVLAEERERSAAALLRDFYEHSPVSMGVVELVGDVYRYLQANAMGAVHLHQRSAADLIGKTAREVGRPPEVIALWVKHLKQAQTAGASEFDFGTADGLHVSVIVKPTRTPEGAPPRFSYVVRDVTAEHRANKLLQDFFACSPFSMGVVELDGAALRFVQVNPIAARHFGVGSPAEMVGKTSVELGRDGKGMALWVGHMRRALEEGTAQFEYYFTENMLLAVHLTATPSPPGALPRFCFLIRDVTTERRATNLLQDCFHYSPFSMGVMELDGEVLRFVQANQVTADHFGLKTPAEVEGKTPLELGEYAADMALWVRHLKQAQVAGVVNFEYFMGRRQFSVHVSPTPAPAGHLPRFCYFVQEVTAERRAAALLGNFFNHSPFSMGVMELEGEVLRFAQANQVTASHFGLKSPAEVVGKTPLELGQTAADMALWARHMKQSQVDGAARFEFGFTGKLWLSVNVSPTPAPPGDPPRYCYIVRDITEERRAAQALAASEERLAFALEATDEGVFDWDLATGQLQVAPHISGQLGLSPGEIRDTLEFWEGLVHPEDVAERRRVLAEHLAGRTEAFGADFRFRHQDGRYIWFHGQGKVVKRGPDGAPRRIVGTHVNITRRKAQEEELRRAKEAAQAGSQAKSEFLANVSHEIRTPLAAILGAADILEERDLAPGKHAHFLEIVRRSGRHLMTLINSLLDFSKIEAERMEVERVPCEVHQMAWELGLLIRQRAAAKAITFAVECPAPLRMVTDPTRLRQILVNLLDNAVKFTGPGGKVELRVRRAEGPEARPLTVASPIASPIMVFEFTDTGIGISPEQQARLFQPFMQADSSTTRRYGGTGLGLAISRRLARLLGGDIEVRSKAGEGSCFTLWLPLEAGEPQGKTPAPGGSSRARLEARVLLVEDGEDIQMLLAHVLERAGATLDMADDGAAGVAKARAAHAAGQDYDVILMDIQMPGMDGLAATAEIRKLGIGVPIIALSAAGLEKNRREALAAGCDDYVLKPIDTDRLLEVLGHWVHNRPVGFEV